MNSAPHTVEATETAQDANTALGKSAPGRSRVWWILAITIACGFLLTGSFWNGVFKTPKSGGLVVEREDLEFGEAWAQPSFQWTIPVRNASKNRLDVSGIHTSCTCTAVSPRMFSIAPGETQEVRLTLNLLPGNFREAEQEVRDFAVVLYPQFGQARDSQVEWTVSGRVRNPFRVSPQSVAFTGADRIIEAMPSSGKVIIVRAFAKLQSLQATCDSRWAAIRVSKSGAFPTTFAVAISPMSQMPVGPFRFEVLLKGKLSDGRQLPPIAVPVTGIVEPDVYALPESIDVGVCMTPSESRTKVALCSHRGERFSITRTNCVGFEAAVTQSSRGLHARHELSVVVNIRGKGELRGQLEVVTRSETGAGKSLTVPIQAYGTAKPKR